MNYRLRSGLTYAKLVYLNLSFYSLFLVFSAVYIPAVTLLGETVGLLLSTRTKMRMFRRATSQYGYIIVRILAFPLVRVQYREFGTRPCPEPAIFVCNHVSVSDPFLLGLLKGEFIQVVNIWPFRLPVLGVYARWVGNLSIREMPFEEFAARIRQLLEDGVSIIAFPEGTRTRTGEMGPFHGALFRIALATRTPIVPLCIHGNEQIPSIGSLILRPGIIRMHRLPAIRPEEYEGLSSFQLKNRARDAIRAELARLDEGKH